MTKIFGKLRRWFSGYEPEAIGQAQSNKFHRCALELDGVNEYLISNNGVATNFGIGNSFSLAVWVEHDTLTNFDTIFDFTINQANLTEGRILLQQLPGFSTNFFAVYSEDGSAFESVSTSESNTAGFHYYVLVKDGTDSLTAYYDGEAMGQETATVPTTADWDRIMTIGVQADESTGFWNGLFHSMAMWDVALGPEEVAAIYCGGYGAYVDLKFNIDHGPGCTYRSAPNLLHWWRPTYDWSNQGKDYGYADNLITLTLNNLTIADISHRDPRGGAITLNGSNEQIINTDLNDYGLGNSFSAMVWFQADTWDGVLDTFMDFCPVAATNIDRLFVFSFLGTLFAAVYDGEGNVAQVNAGPIPGQNFTVHQFMIVKDGSDTLYFYVNGKEAATAASIETRNVNRLGGILSDNDSTYFFDGWAIQAATWDKALTAAEVKAIYNGGHGNIDLKKRWGEYTSYGNLKHWWCFSQTNGAFDGFLTNFNWGYDWAPSNKIDMKKDSVGINRANKRSFPRNTSGVCVDLDGSTEYLAKNQDTLIGIANTWTLSMWVYGDTATTAGMTPFHLRTTSPDSVLGEILLIQQGNVAGDPFQLEAGGDKIYRYANLMVNNTWYHLVVTWDGTNLKLYVNTVVKTPLVKIVDNALTMVDSARAVAVGCQYDSASPNLYWNGRIQHVAMWSSVLSQTEINEVYVGLNTMDLNADFGGYESSGNLEHWWKIGEDCDDIGKDYANSPSVGSIDIDTNSANVAYPADFLGDSPRHGSN
jgi:hypothetical protein